METNWYERLLREATESGRGSRPAPGLYYLESPEQSTGERGEELFAESKEGSESAKVFLEWKNPSETAESKSVAASTVSNSMTREELNAHLEANEARVERMTDRVEQRLQAMDEKLDAHLGQIGQIDEKMEEREDKFYSQIESTLANFRAERQSDLGDLKEDIGELSGELEGVRDSNRASFRNNRILVGVAGVVLVIVQILVTVLLT